MSINYKCLKEWGGAWFLISSRYLRHSGFSVTPGGRLGRKFPLLSSSLARGQARLKRAFMSQAAPTTKIEMTAEMANTRPVVDQISSLKPA